MDKFFHCRFLPKKFAHNALLAALRLFKLYLLRQAAVFGLHCAKLEEIR